MPPSPEWKKHTPDCSNYERQNLTAARVLMGRWLDPKVEGTQELVDAAVQAALPVAAGLGVYKVAPLRRCAGMARAVRPGGLPPRVALVDPKICRCENPAEVR